MSLLLTDDEMKKSRDGIPACDATLGHADDFPCSACSGGCSEIAQLQLEKVKKLLLELDRKHSGRQGAIWADIISIFELF